MEITRELTPGQQARLDELRAFIGAVRIALELEEADPGLIRRVINRLMWGYPHDPLEPSLMIGREMTEIISHASVSALICADEISSLPGVAAILERDRT